MRIIEQYRSGFVISFEVFPPKTEAGVSKLMDELEILAVYKPGFISVTYGAGGSTRDRTLDLSLSVRERFNIEPLVHFTCVGADRDEISDYINIVKSYDLENILALRGDPPEGEDRFAPPVNGFAHANELVEHISKIGSFCIAVAGYPECHVEAPDIDTDIDNLKRKVDSGADYVITQLFFDNEDFYRFMDMARKKGISVPVVPGIMPVTNLAQLEKITDMFNPGIPEKLKSALHHAGSPEDMFSAGVEYSVEQCRELKKYGVPGFHFYPLNRAGAVSVIIDSL